MTTGLRAGAIGAAGMTFMVVAATAPLTAMSSNIALSLGFGVGAATTAVILIVGALLAVFAVGYLVLSRHVTNAAAYQAFVQFGLGRTAGAATAFVAALAYVIATTGMIAATGYFGALTISALTGLAVPWWALSAIALVLVYGLGVRGLEIGGRVTTAVSLLQFVVIVALAVAVLVRRPHGWSTEVFSPVAAAGPGIALTVVFVLLCFGGFEAAAAYGEEARAARRSIAIATAGSLALLVAVFALGTWTLSAAVDDVRALAVADPGGLVVTVAARYLGPWSGPCLAGLVTISFLAAGVAFGNLATRYLFALGRAGLLPTRLAVVHPRWSSPLAGCRVLAVAAIVVLVPFAALGLDPIVALFPALSGITALALVLMLTGCCASTVVAALRGKLSESRWATIVAPTAAGLTLLGALVLVVVQYDQVTGSDAIVVRLMPLSLLIAALWGALAVRRAPARQLEGNLA